MLLKLILLGGLIYFVVRLQSKKQIDQGENNSEEFVDYEEVDD